MAGGISPETDKGCEDEGSKNRVYPLESGPARVGGSARALEIFECSELYERSGANSR